jgi:hypothetical protein
MSVLDRSMYQPLTTGSVYPTWVSGLRILRHGRQWFIVRSLSIVLVTHTTNSYTKRSHCFINALSRKARDWLFGEISLVWMKILPLRQNAIDIRMVQGKGGVIG